MKKSNNNFPHPQKQERKQFMVNTQSDKNLETCYAMKYHVSSHCVLDEMYNEANIFLKSHFFYQNTYRRIYEFD